MRRATPDSEVLASYQEKRPLPSAVTVDGFPMKENGLSGLGGRIWPSNLSRGYFELGEQTRRHAARKARLGAPTNELARSANTPSPATSSGHGANSLPFAISLQTTPKVGRSLSYSQGRRETPPSSTASMQQAVAGNRRPSTLPLGLLNKEAEEFDDAESERESDLGGLLTQTASHPVFGNPQRISTLPTQYPRYPDTFNGSLFDRRLEAVLSELNLNVQVHNNTDNSTVNTEKGMPHINVNEAFTVPEGYKVPHVSLKPYERNINDDHVVGLPFANGLPRKMLYIISFKCCRVGIFYLPDNSGLIISEGDVVIVEAGRGQDLGVVQHARITQEEARNLLAKYGEEQYKWLMQKSRAGAVDSNTAVYDETNGTDNINMRSTRPPRDQYQNLKPKAMKRMAAPHEVRMLMDKESNEARAKHTCQQKVLRHHLNMEILEAEFQWDWQKLIFYYYADQYVNFKGLINDLYKLYKVRLWMSAVNPAAFSRNAINQPPTGIGPGASTASPNSGPAFDNTYTMKYGTKPGPYDTITPYQIPLNTYHSQQPRHYRRYIEEKLQQHQIH